MVQFVTLMVTAMMALGVKALDSAQDVAPAENYIADFIKDADAFFSDVLHPSSLSFSVEAAQPSASLAKRAFNEEASASWNGDIPESLKDLLRSRREAIRSAMSAKQEEQSVAALSLEAEASMVPEKVRRGIEEDAFGFNIGDIVGDLIQSEIKQHIEDSISHFIDDHKSDISSIRSEIGSSLDPEYVRTKLLDAAKNFSASSSASATSDAPKPTGLIF